MIDRLPPLDSKIVLKLSLALLLAVRCRQKDASKQLLAEIYHKFSEEQAKTTMNRLIYLMEPSERDWMRDLA
jgi:hypothetical protein